MRYKRISVDLTNLNELRAFNNSRQYNSDDTIPNAVEIHTGI